MRSYYFLFALLLPGIGFAQNSNQNKEAEQIIITKKGAADGKMNIVVDGDKVTVNGKPVSDDAGADISVKRKKIKDMEVYNDGGQWSPGRSFNDLGGNWQQMPAPNKAMLGVVTRKTDEGVSIVNVTEESAADKAGLKEGDIITEVDGKEITTPDELSGAVKDKEPGDKLSVSYKRDGKVFTTSATLTKWKAPQNNMYFDQRNGNAYSMPPMDLNQLFRQLPQGRNGNRNYQFYNFPEMESGSPKIGIRIQDMDKGAGVKILDVERGSDADKAGLREGDIIKEINGRSINSTVSAGKAIREHTKAPTEFKIIRNGRTQTVAVNQSSGAKTADL